MVKEKLHNIRIRKGFTQKDIAEVIHTTVPNYCKKENGKVKITNEEWQKIANYLKVSFDDIYEEDEGKVYINTENQTGDNIGNYINHNIHESIVSQLLDYIKLLKEENETLKQKLKN